MLEEQTLKGKRLGFCTDPMFPDVVINQGDTHVSDMFESLGRPDDAGQFATPGPLAALGMMTNDGPRGISHEVTSSQLCEI